MHSSLHPHGVGKRGRFTIASMGLRVNSDLTFQLWVFSTKQIKDNEECAFSILEIQNINIVKIFLVTICFAQKDFHSRSHAPLAWAGVPQWRDAHLSAILSAKLGHVHVQISKATTWISIPLYHIVSNQASVHLYRHCLLPCPKYICIRHCTPMGLEKEGGSQ